MGLAAAAAWPAGAAVIEPVTITSEALAPARHLFASDFHMDKKAPSSLEGLLAHAKRAFYAGEAAACLRALAAASPKAKAVRSWTLALELDCAASALALPEKPREKGPAPKSKSKKGKDKSQDGEEKKPNLATLERLHQAIAKVERNPGALVNGPAAGTLREALIRGWLATLDVDIKVNRDRAAKSIERLQDLVVYADEGQRARLWRNAAELVYGHQDAPGAAELLKRSLAAQDSTETRARLIAIESSIKASAAPSPSPLPSPAKNGTAPLVPNPELEASKEEIELVERATAALKAGDLVSAVDDAVKLLTAYPGGSRAKWAAERVAESYWSIAEKTDLKLAFSRAQIVRKMQEADGDRLAEWARTMYSRGQWEDAMTLSSRALDKLEGSRTTAILDLAAKSALASDQFEQARRFLDRLVLAHAGTPAAREALLRSGLLRFRQKEYQLAAADFERLLVLPQLNSWELPARYWLWRSLQKLQAGDAKSGDETDRAAPAAAELIRKFPFSYYGLRARLETNGGALEWKSSNEKFSAQFLLTAHQRHAWERLQILLKAGWLEEAQIELRTFPQVKKAADKAVVALLAAAAGAYATAAKLANEAWDESPELRREPLVTAAFPKAFAETIAQEAGARKLDRDLLRGLIKQESSFNPRAISSSNAYGLTQVISPTAREIAQDLKQPALSLPDDLFQPERSVQFGAYYLAKLLNKYSGSVPLALASYNAGPTRIDRWLKARPSLKNLAALRSSAPEDELWFDEIPYGETSNYVKAILRNLLIYKMLDNGRVQVPEPIWAFAAEGR